MKAMVQFAWVEWTMQRRALRTWLLALLLVFMARYFFVYEWARSDDWGQEWRRVGGNLATWALDPIGAVLCLAVLLFSIDAAAWAQRPAHREILYPRPFSNGALVLGRFFGLYSVTALLALVPLATLAVYAVLTPEAVMDVHAAWFVYSRLWLPALAAGVASALWIRGMLPSTMGAGVVVLLGWGALLYASASLPPDSMLHLPLDDMRMQGGYLAGPGLLVLTRPLLGFIAGMLLLALLFLALAAVQLDRRGRLTLQRGARFWQLPTFRYIVASLWPGTWPGGLAALLLLGAIAGWTALAGMDVLRHQERIAKITAWEAGIETILGDDAKKVRGVTGLERMVLGEPPSESVRVLARELEIAFDPATGEINGVARLTLEGNGSDTLDLTLNPGLDVESVSVNPPAPIAFQRAFNRLYVAAPASATFEIEIAYSGMLVTRTPGPLPQATAELYRPALPQRRWVHLDAALAWFPEPTAASPRRSAPPASDAAAPQPARYHVHAPPSHGLTWAAAGQRDGNAWASDRPVRDLGLMIGPYDVADGTLAALPVRLFYFHDNEIAARTYLWDSQLLLSEIAEMLGPYPFERLTVVEAPQGHPPTAGAGMPALATRDLLIVAHALHEERRQTWVNVRTRFRYLNPWQIDELERQIVDDYLRAAILPLSPLLAEALPEYVRQTLTSHRGEGALQTGTRDFDVPRRLARWYRMPLAETEASRFPDRAEVLSRRGLALFHMLRYRLGDEKWKRLLAAYSERYRFRPARWEDFLALAEEVLGESLDGFNREWTVQGVLPEYAIRRARGVMMDDPDTLGMDYRVEIEVENVGTGSTPVPIYLRTERDRIFRDPKIAPGEIAKIEMVVPDRPLFVEIDPLGWILQQPRYSEEMQDYRHDHTKVEIWEREPGT